VLLSLIWPVYAPIQAIAGPGETCRQQAAAAERSAGVPAGLLLAVGKRESGRSDAQTGETLPWPWAVNREGEGHIFASLAEAVAYVAAAQRDGSRSIDVGCFQINLKNHPDAFMSLEDAFDPAINAAYAARFLSDLESRTGSWEAAVANYHSATPWFGEPYRDAVLAIWHGLAPPTGIFANQNPVRSFMGIRVWGPSTVLASAGQREAMPARTLLNIAVFTPTGSVAPISARWRHGNLPPVFTPTTSATSH
jgi:hypothetical protein